MSETERIRDLIEASSLGTPEAKALRASVPDELAAKAVQRSKDYRLMRELAIDLLRAKHWNNPDRPAPMVRAGCAEPLAEALFHMGWRRPAPDEPAREPESDGREGGAA